MASNYRRRSDSSDSRRSVSVRPEGGRPSRGRKSMGGKSGNYYVSSTIGDMDRSERKERARATRRRWTVRLIVIAVLIALVIGGGIFLYASPVFQVKHVTIKGADHLTEQEMMALSEIPEDTTLLRVDDAKIIQNCLRDAWIKDVQVNRVFPDTLELVVTERTINATVAVPTGSSAVTRVWAISSDGVWLMPIPDKESPAAATVAPKIYEDAEAVLQIVDVPYGTQAEIGTQCTDANVNNALAIVSGMTTKLADMVVRVSATDAESTILTLDNGVEIAFGAAEDIRDKERVCLSLLEEYDGLIAYINVRSVTSPTWRSL